MSYAAEVARGIQAEAEKEFDNMIVNSGTELIRMSKVMQRVLHYQDAAEVFEFADSLHWQGKKVDDACEQVRRANRPKGTPIRKMDW